VLLAAPLAQPHVVERLQLVAADQLAERGDVVGTFLRVASQVAHQLQGVQRRTEGARPCAVVVGFSGALLKPGVLGGEIRSRPPVLLVHGDADTVVPFQALALAEEALELNGVPVAAYRRPGLGHGIDQEGLQLCAMALVQHLFPESLAEPGTAPAP